jgi:hypothetical protein
VKKIVFPLLAWGSLVLFGGVSNRKDLVVKDILKDYDVPLWGFYL